MEDFVNIVILDGYCLNHGDLDWSGFEKLGDVTIYDRTPYEKIVERMGDAPIMITNKCSIDKKIIDALPQLKYVGALATGYNNIDCDYAREKGIVVTNIPSYSTESVVQSVFGIMIELFSKIGAHNASVKNGDWVQSPDFCYYFDGIKELANKTLGIIGYGSIGRRVATVARAFGMKVVAYSRHKTQDDSEGFRFADSVEEVLEKSDVISLNCPLTKENTGFINEEAISKMKRGAYIINTARGGLVDEKAVAQALNDGRLGGFGADVLSTEPPKIDNPLLNAKNTIITPHTAWATQEARSRLMEIAINNLSSFLNGEETNRVN